MAGYDNNKLGELRPNQIITTFGPGAIVDAVKDSVTVLDINYWKEKGKKIIDGNHTFDFVRYLFFRGDLEMRGSKVPIPAGETALYKGRTFYCLRRYNGRQSQQVGAAIYRHSVQRKQIGTGIAASYKHCRTSISTCRNSR